MTTKAAFPALKEIWSGRCPVPTATGLALKLGWLREEFAPDGTAVVDRREQGAERWQQTHGDLPPPLFREGGAIPALIGRSRGERTRLIGLTWIDEWQTLLVRPDSGITHPAQLKGKRLAVPAWGLQDEGRRSSSIARGMSLHGYSNALAYAGLGWGDVTLVEVGSGDGREREGTPDSGDSLQALWAGIAPLARGEVDAVYVKGASAVDAARRAGVVVGIDLDALPSRVRVNNGTPRPLTVPEYLLEQHFDAVVRYLAQTIRAAEWARTHEADVHGILLNETRGGAEAVATAYRNDFHRSLHPDLSEERLAFFTLQKDFLLLHGFLDRDFRIADWFDRRPLEAAWQLYRQWQQEGRFDKASAGEALV